MPEIPPLEILAAFEQIPRGLFVLTSQHEGRRAGIVVRGVQPCADEPPMLIVSVRKGNQVAPLIRDSRVFAICQVDAGDRLILRKFAEGTKPRDGDPFDCFGVERLVTGSPVLSKSGLVFDCEVVRHFDLESDHELYVGQVRGVKQMPPAVHQRTG